MKVQCIWEAHIRNITVLFSGYPQPSLSWAEADGTQIRPSETAYKMYMEPYWENGRLDEWMGNLEVRGRVHIISAISALELCLERRLPVSVTLFSKVSLIIILLGVVFHCLHSET